MSLLSLHTVSIAFGGLPLLDGVSLDVHKGQRISILGRNGVGKSTLMKIIGGEMLPDAGDVIREPGLRCAYLPQGIEAELEGKASDIAARGARKAESWHVETVVKRVLEQVQVDPDADFRMLSGGMRRRVLLARALAGEPDLLLLDEPTNHCDIPTITWLESFILNARLCVVFVTHDRRLLKRLATRIIELDRGSLFDWSCDYETFLARKEAALETEQKEWARFDKKLAQEEVWIRKGIKARRTRNEGRVRALKRLRDERQKRRERSGAVSLVISEAPRSGDLVIETVKAGFSFGEKTVIRDLTVTVMRSDRIGIIGPNGCGKSTLVNLLVGTLAPQEGIIRRGTNCEIVYFDQLREVLEPEKTVWENVAPGGGDTVFVNNAPVHVITYLRDFLFTADRAKSPVKQLSGGERNRLLIARLFTRPANVLVLDEPTNDLDQETLELLEERLAEFGGTVLVVSHDREFLNNVVTTTLAFEEGGMVREYVGGYDDWERQKPPEEKKTRPKKDGPAVMASPLAGTVLKKKLSYGEKKELAELPQKIEQLEQERDELHLRMGDAEWYAKPGFIGEANTRLAAIELAHHAAFERWEELDNRPQ